MITHYINQYTYEMFTFTVLLPWVEAWPNLASVDKISIQPLRSKTKAPFTLQKIFGTAWIKMAGVPKKKGSARVNFVV